MTAPGSGPYLLTDDERDAAVHALHDYRFETKQYLSTMSFTPCHPDCQHCKPKVAHFAEMHADLQQRQDIIDAALAALTASAWTES